VHAPATQVSVWVQAFPSEHAAPSVFVGFEQNPLAGSHAPATWHASVAEHAIGFAPVHAPATHVSLWVQAFPSLHVVPSGRAGFEHAPVPGLQTPIAWHASLAAHVTGLAPVQLPALQVSVWVHALPSEHDVPSAAGGLEHTPVAGLHDPAT